MNSLVLSLSCAHSLCVMQASRNTTHTYCLLRQTPVDTLMDTVHTDTRTCQNTHADMHSLRNVQLSGDMHIRTCHHDTETDICA